MNIWLQQIATVTVNGSQSIEIDKDVASGRDMGVSSVACVPGIDTNFNYDYKASLLSGIKNFADNIDPTNQLGLIRSYSESLDKILEHDVRAGPSNICHERLTRRRNTSPIWRMLTAFGRYDYDCCAEASG